jgi:polysaccharide export outer membrane protein
MKLMQTMRRKTKWVAGAAEGAVCVTLILAVSSVRPGALAQDTGSAATPANPPAAYSQTTGDYNRRLAGLNGEASNQAVNSGPDLGFADYRIGPDDQLDISVLEASELGGKPRVSDGGTISLPLVGTVKAAGLTTLELQAVIEELLRHSYIKDPHVTVQVSDVQSHPVSVFGAVKKPGVFQIRDPKTVVEMLSMAEGLDSDAGDKVIVERRGEEDDSAAAALNGGSPPARDARMDSAGRDSLLLPASLKTDSSTGSVPQAEKNPSTVTINLKRLLDTGDPRLDVLVYPGDVVKVPRADLVYVVGEVGKPGGFELKSNERISVLQAVALAEGLTHTSAASHARIIRTDPATGARKEIPINLNKILAGKAADPLLHPRDIVFVPNSAGKAAIYRGVEAATSIGAGIAVYRW